MLNDHLQDLLSHFNYLWGYCLHCNDLLHLHWDLFIVFDKGSDFNYLFSNQLSRNFSNHGNGDSCFDSNWDLFCARDGFFEVDWNSFLMCVVFIYHFFHNVGFWFNHLDLFSFNSKNLSLQVDVLGLILDVVPHIGIDDLSDSLNWLFDNNLLDLKLCPHLVQYLIPLNDLRNLNYIFDYLLDLHCLLLDHLNGDLVLEGNYDLLLVNLNLSHGHQSIDDLLLDDRNFLFNNNLHWHFVFHLNLSYNLDFLVEIYYLLHIHWLNSDSFNWLFHNLWNNLLNFSRKIPWHLDRKFNNLEDLNLSFNDLLHYLRDMDDILDNPRNYDNLLDYLLDLDHSRNFHHLFYDLFNDDSHWSDNFFFTDNGYRNFSNHFQLNFLSIGNNSLFFECDNLYFILDEGNSDFDEDRLLLYNP